MQNTHPVFAHLLANGSGYLFVNLVSVRGKSGLRVLGQCQWVTALEIHSLMSLLVLAFVITSSSCTPICLTWLSAKEPFFARVADVDKNSLRQDNPYCGCRAFRLEQTCVVVDDRWTRMGCHTRRGRGYRWRDWTREATMDGQEKGYPFAAGEM